jgi:hypothetical protein
MHEVSRRCAVSHNSDESNSPFLIQPIAPLSVSTSISFLKRLRILGWSPKFSVCNLHELLAETFGPDSQPQEHLQSR